jgi:hypothetical protein
MDNANIIIEKKINANNPVLIEGLPGLGLVGKLGADHLIKELGATKFAELHCHEFPPQVMITEESLIKLRKNEFYYWKAKEKGQRDIIILVGDDQGLTVSSQYQICNKVIDFVEGYGTDMIYTLGGYGMQKLTKNPKVYGAVTHKELVGNFKKYDVVFQKTPGSIVGAAGLLLGIGALKGMKGVCLMGETHGNYIDARAAKNVLRVVSESLNLDIHYKDLEKKAKETEEMINKLETLQTQQLPQEGVFPQEKGDESQSYIR